MKKKNTFFSPHPPPYPLPDKWLSNAPKSNMQFANVFAQQCPIQTGKPIDNE